MPTIESEQNTLAVKYIPEEDVVLFFAKIDEHRFCIIYGPPEYLPTQGQYFTELGGIAKVCIGGKDSELEPQPVKHGHKYAHGGGMVEFGRGEFIHFCPPNIISTYPWRENTYTEDLLQEAKKIEKVFHCL